MKNLKRSGWVVFAALLSMTPAFSPAAGASPDAIHVSGVGISTPTDWTPARLKSDLAADVKTVEYSSRGQAHHATCVPLLAVLKASGIDPTIKHDSSADPRTKHISLRLSVTVVGRDGYAVTFALADMLPDAGNREIWLALDVDDKPLSGADDPAKLLVPSDAKPSRWVRGVEKIIVADPTGAVAPAK